MADTGIFATTQEVQDAVGANANATYNAEAYINRFIAINEAYINMVCKFNYSAPGVFAALTAGKAKILTKWAVALTASDVIKADMSGAQLAQLQTRLSFLNDVSGKCERLMIEGTKDSVDYLNKTAADVA